MKFQNLRRVVRFWDESIQINSLIKGVRCQQFKAFCSIRHKYMSCFTNCATSESNYNDRNFKNIKFEYWYQYSSDCSDKIFYSHAKNRYRNYLRLVTKTFSGNFFVVGKNLCHPRAAIHKKVQNILKMMQTQNSFQSSLQYRQNRIQNLMLLCIHR